VLKISLRDFVVSYDTVWTLYLHVAVLGLNVSACILSFCWDKSSVWDLGSMFF